MSEVSFINPSPRVVAVQPTPISHEIATLEHMRLRLFQHIHTATEQWDHQSYAFPELQRRHRMIVLDRAQLVQRASLTFVGFFGRRRRNADASVLAGVDEALIDDMHASPHMLSYSSLELANGEWVNFVLMRSSEGLSHWSGGARHTHVARALAPSFYSEVRLHIGTLPNGLDPEQPLIVDRVRHIGYGHMIAEATDE